MFCDKEAMVNSAHRKRAVGSAVFRLQQGRTKRRSVLYTKAIIIDGNNKHFWHRMKPKGLPLQLASLCSPALSFV